jgi:hypothetical protein
MTIAVPETVSFPLINKQGALLYKVVICLCMYALNRSQHTDENANFLRFCLQHGVGPQHVICIPFYAVISLLLSVLLPSCFLYYSQIKALYHYLVHTLVLVISYYSLILLCIIYRPATAALFTLVVSVHVAEKCMVDTGERILYCGHNLRTAFQFFALLLIWFAWIYLPLQIPPPLDFITCLFIPEVTGIGIVFAYYLVNGVCIVTYDTYSKLL